MMIMSYCYGCVSKISLGCKYAVNICDASAHFSAGLQGDFVRRADPCSLNFPSRSKPRNSFAYSAYFLVPSVSSSSRFRISIQRSGTP
jgi:hypothetical protein